MPSVDTHDAPAPESQEYLDGMAAKADAELVSPEEPEGSPETNGEDRPEWLPEKFKSAEELAKAYSSLESKLGSKTSEEETPADPQQTPSVEEAQAMLSDKGLDYSKYEREFVDQGGLSEDSMKELTDQGLSRELVDGFVKGQQSLVEQSRRDAFDVAGGEEEFGQMMDWATKNLSETEVEQYNSMLGVNAENNRFATRSLAALWRQETGFAPSLIQGRGNPAPSGYQSWAQVSEAMRDPRYQKDSAYRRTVEQRVSQSSSLDN